jgi:uncharacterized membrane protein
VQFTIFVCVLFILPTVHPVNKLNMNYAVVAVGGVMLLVVLMWVFWGRTQFSGPVFTRVELEGRKEVARENENEKEKEG